jgi:hypothetical protein
MPTLLIIAVGVLIAGALVFFALCLARMAKGN